MCERVKWPHVPSDSVAQTLRRILRTKALYVLKPYVPTIRRRPVGVVLPPKRVDDPSDGETSSSNTIAPIDWGYGWLFDEATSLTISRVKSRFAKIWLDHMEDCLSNGKLTKFGIWGTVVVCVLFATSPGFRASMMRRAMARVAKSVIRVTRDGVKYASGSYLYMGMVYTASVLPFAQGFIEAIRQRNSAIILHALIPIMGYLACLMLVEFLLTSTLEPRFKMWVGLESHVTMAPRKKFLVDYEDAK
jgi:hypothetical protein